MKIYFTLLLVWFSSSIYGQFKHEENYNFVIEEKHSNYDENKLKILSVDFSLAKTTAKNTQLSLPYTPMFFSVSIPAAIGDTARHPLGKKIIWTENGKIILINQYGDSNELLSYGNTLAQSLNFKKTTTFFLQYSSKQMYNRFDVSDSAMFYDLYRTEKNKNTLIKKNWYIVGKQLGVLQFGNFNTIDSHHNVFIRIPYRKIGSKELFNYQKGDWLEYEYREYFNPSDYALLEIIDVKNDSFYIKETFLERTFNSTLQRVENSLSYKYYTRAKRNGVIDSFNLPYYYYTPSMCYGFENKKDGFVDKPAANVFYYDTIKNRYKLSSFFEYVHLFEDWNYEWDCEECAGLTVKYSPLSTSQEVITHVLKSYNLKNCGSYGNRMLGNKDLAQLSTTTLSPNPANNQIFVNFNQTKNQNYKIVDLHGKLMQSGIFLHSIDVQSLPSGIYFLHCDTLQTGIKFIKL